VITPAHSSRDPGLLLTTVLLLAALTQPSSTSPPSNPSSSASPGKQRAAARCAEQAITQEQAITPALDRGFQWFSFTRGRVFVGLVHSRRSRSILAGSTSSAPVAPSMYATCPLAFQYGD
jgi:hypothetical protein